MRTTLLSLALTSLAAAPAIAGDNWYADYDEALAVAKEQQKDLLVDFTGSDWCGWCIRLDDEVFSTETFLSAVEDKFVLVKLDFPRDEELKAAVPNPDRNRELQQQFEVSGFPTIALVNSNGERFAETGYRSGGPEPYLEHLTEITKSGKRTLEQMPKLMAKYAAAEGAEKHAVLGQLIDLAEMQDERSPFIGDLLGVARKVFAEEGEDAMPLKRRVLEIFLDAGEYDDELAGLAKELDPQNAEGMRERVLANKMQTLTSGEAASAWVTEAVALLEEVELVDEELKLHLFINIAYMANKYSEDADIAAKYAVMALELGVDDERTAGMLRDLAGISEESGS